MTIRNKLFSIGFLIIFGFIAASYLIYTQFQEAMDLKRIELEGVKIQTLQNELSLKSARFISDRNLIDNTYEDWLDSYSEFYKELKSFTENPGINRLGGKIKYILDQISRGWDTIFNNYYKPINIQLNVLMNDRNLKEIDTEMTSIIDLFEMLKSGAIDNEKLKEEFGVLENNMMMIDQSMTEINALFDEVLLEINAGIDRFIAENRVGTIQLLGLILGLIVVISTLFSRQTTLNIKKMEKYIARLAEGDFSARLEIKSRDEFGSLSQDFTVFTDTLWEKMDSLRDVMRDIGNSISVDLNQQGFIDNMVELAIDSSKAEAGIMFTVEEESRKLVVSNISGYFPPPFQVSRKVSNRKDSLIAYFKSITFNVGQGLIGEVASSGTPVFIKDSFEDDRLPFNSFPEDELYISSMVLIPLIVGNRLLGILGVCKTKEGDHFSDLDFSFLRSYGEYSAMALDNLNKYRELLSRHELVKELNVASDIQKNLLPDKLPVVKSASLHAYSEAAKGISGDYYDAFKLNDNKLLITVCDVAGKGVPASLVMTMIRTILRLITSTTHNARSVVTMLNNLLTARLGIDHFATIGLFIYDTEKKVVSYTNGAHHPLYVYKAEKDKFVKFDTDGLPLGLEADTVFGHKRFQVSEGDYLVLFTDGLNEARNSVGEEFTTNRLLSIIRHNASLDPVSLTEEIRKNLKVFTEGMDQHDDQTLLLMKVN
ncbi:SpoIIE family protein phosphatase [Spirochaeta isovalerica]|uniref:Serine phosphatase RsbU (Regulator of sigma subunit)/HAMP domain-containing protein n=1 Tax=Spirochaeta isovalerica TaxID=150 RepID=A0A841R3K4_9SPIO|nr:SpoIIE family protein phosphatase [Spirochaeta isovalerica]MBB6478455.1 serine phosphatase RsbU (regulator of sigma subunit)/HAMP domain-containing protein [Spirochaeta isovalerica]